MRGRRKAVTKGLVQQLVTRVTAMREERSRKRNQPPDDEKLALIWPPWNACPPEIEGAERRHILTGNQECLHPGLLERLKAQFPYLPFDADEFSSSFDAVEVWLSLEQSVRTTFELHRPLVESQWTFSASDSQAVGRIAVFRAAKELDITHPGLRSKPAPLVKDIHIFQQRYHAYLTARNAALRALEDVLYKVPGIRKGLPLPISRRAVGVPRPPSDVPDYLYIARLDALGICSQKRFKDFMRQEFPGLDYQQRQEFYKMGCSPRFGKETHASLQIWVVDNAPVFEAFNWRWPDIHTAAVNRSLLDKHRHASHQNLEKWASRNGIKWPMKTGVPPVEQRLEIKRSSPLLSPRPVFGDILTAQSPTST